MTVALKVSQRQHKASLLEKAHNIAKISWKLMAWEVFKNQKNATKNRIGKEKMKEC